MGSETARTDQQKELHMGLALQHLFRYHEDSAFLDDEKNRIITGDETKRDSMQWKHASLPPPTKFKTMASTSKVLLTIFFKVQGPLLVEFLKHRGSINSDVYCETLQSLCRSIKNKRPGLLTNGVVLFHGNACPHISRVKLAKLTKFKWEQLDHSPYSPDISPCNFHVFGSPKKHLKGQRLNLDDKLKDDEKDWVSSRPQEC